MQVLLTTMDHILVRILCLLRYDFICPDKWYVNLQECCSCMTNTNRIVSVFAISYWHKNLYIKLVLTNAFVKDSCCY